MTGGAHERELGLLRRATVLEACRDEVRSRRELEETTEASRATVYRATTELEDRGLLEQQNGGYRTTATGEAVSLAVENFVTAIGTIERLEPLFERLSHPELLRNAHLLADADLTVADDDNMYRANDRAVKLFGQSSAIRAAMTGSGSRLCIEESTAEAAASDMDVEMCFAPGALPTDEHLNFDSPDVSRLFEHFEVHVSEAVPFSFVLHDDVATVVARNEVGIPVVVAECDDAHLYAWLEGLYAECKASARPVEQLRA